MQVDFAEYLNTFTENAQLMILALDFNLADWSEIDRLDGFL
jgi:hypothetical protein